MFNIFLYCNYSNQIFWLDDSCFASWSHGAPAHLWPGIPFDASINPYQGCEHGCIYCYARPTHAYLGHSPGLDFETKLYAKANAAALSEKAFSKPGYVPQLIVLVANTDPYQPIEREHWISRSILEVMERSDHPVAVTTKSGLITLDIDILARMSPS